MLRVIGDGPARLMLQDRAKRLGLQGRVAFLGPLDDAALHRWFRTARIYVSMSSREAFGIALLEALAAGAAVVATDIPAHREVASGTPHVVALVPLGATAEKLARTVQAMATCARVAVPLLSVPSWETVAAQTIDVYRAITAPTV